MSVSRQFSGTLYDLNKGQEEENQYLGLLVEVNCMIEKPIKVLENKGFFSIIFPDNIQIDNLTQNDVYSELKKFKQSIIDKPL